MDNNIKQPNINYTTNFINNTYDPLSYFDLYGNSVIIFIYLNAKFYHFGRNNFN